jgi:hypothetical protein
MPTDDAEIEAAAKRAWQAWLTTPRFAPVDWEDLTPCERNDWLAVARVAQPPPKLCGTCRFWGSD